VLLTVGVAGLQACVVVLAALVDLPSRLLWIPLFALVGLFGVTRCVFWAQMYRTLGGISTLDPDVPGGGEPERETVGSP